MDVAVARLGGSSPEKEPGAVGRRAGAEAAGGGRRGRAARELGGERGCRGGQSVKPESLVPGKLFPDKIFSSKIFSGSLFRGLRLATTMGRTFILAFPLPFPAFAPFTFSTRWAAL